MGGLRYCPHFPPPNRHPDRPEEALVLQSGLIPLIRLPTRGHGQLCHHGRPSKSDETQRLEPATLHQHRQGISRCTTRTRLVEFWSGIKEFRTSEVTSLVLGEHGQRNSNA